MTFVSECAFQNTIYRHILPGRCYDLSTQCNMWVVPSRRGQKSGGGHCHINPEFMHHICPHACKVCTEHFTSDIAYTAFHRPIHSFPVNLHGVTRFVRKLLLDIVDMTRKRLTVAVTIFAVGVLAPINIAVFVKIWKIRPSQPYLSKGVSGGTIVDIALLLCAGVMTAWMSWIVSITSTEVPPILRSVHSDMIGVANFTGVFILIISVGITAGIYLRSLLSYSIRGKMNTDSLIPSLLTIMCLIFAAHFTLLSFNVEQDFQWNHTWKYHRGAVSIVIFISAFAGTGLLSLERLIIAPIVKNVTIFVYLPNMIVSAVLMVLVVIHPHFNVDMMNAIQMETNAAVAFVLFGIMIGHTLGNILDNKSNST
jgi:hypothetical protein